MHSFRFASLLLIACVAGCTSKPKLSQISGNVSFNDKPIPAGYVSFTPRVEEGTQGHVHLFMVENGVYNSAKAPEPGIPPGVYNIEIGGYDGKKIPMFYQGKQIFNPIQDIYTVPDGVSTKDFVVPKSAGDNVKIQPTADY